MTSFSLFFSFAFAVLFHGSVDAGMGGKLTVDNACSRAANYYKDNLEAFDSAINGEDLTCESKCQNCDPNVNTVLSGKKPCFFVSAATSSLNLDFRRRSSGMCFVIPPNTLMNGDVRLTNFDDCVYVAGSANNTIRLGSGDDKFFMLNEQWKKKREVFSIDLDDDNANAFVVEGGDGNDTFYVRGTKFRALYGNDGKDVFSIAGVTKARSVAAAAGKASGTFNPVLGLFDVAIPQFGDIEGGDGGDVVVVKNSALSEIEGNDDDDFVALFNSTVDVLRMLDGTDLVYLFNSTVKQYIGGDGRDGVVVGPGGSVTTGEVTTDDSESDAEPEIKCQVTFAPTASPTAAPTAVPTAVPTSTPTAVPTPFPTATPTSYYVSPVGSP